MQLPQWGTPPPAGGDGGSTGIGGGLDSAGNVAMVANPALGIGLKAAGGLASLWAGRYGRKVRKQGVEGLRGMIGKPVFDPGTAYAYARGATYNDMNRLGNSFDRRFDMDTGRGAGMFGKAIAERLGSQSSGLYVDAETARAERDRRIYEALAGFQG